MKSNIVLMLVGIYAALTASAYTDGEVIAHFPFDEDFASIVNTDKNPTTFSTFGTVAITAGGTMGAAIRDGRSFRENAGFLETTDGRLARAAHGRLPEPCEELRREHRRVPHHEGRAARGQVPEGAQRRRGAHFPLS